ncbi:hypothetical protein [Burkholderia thailandensis]|uniref:Type IIA topoisomerase n=1 Tax=Burkholderia thailandensis (strain ATCC 700388 / DSM 13276 / CCUG 48851 / CIP 106301 / E264) TaxID=271848 RepID=Q2T7B1_BURTA|nr:hypothetical protein [Burkholderia thailandensis]ABC35726.1 conserved hypothetical protein [Burkholderia thailandensis E264]AHI75812.1 putative type IIA topoisomerase [Burkholderia thailandensis 2002721723]AHI81115.1 putative type IIA topoisomerase [Burkholderia thailandensis E444]AIP28843.1 putative type IIA topoisomerase [Burkholderia thailandensis E264]AJY00683.1 putative type IIA topoisomerase [Burkholderia thailandensis 2002721643]
MLKSVQQSTQPPAAAAPDRSAPAPSPNQPGRPRRSLGPFSHGTLRSAREMSNQTRNDEAPRLPPLSFGEPLPLDHIAGRPPHTPPGARTSGPRDNTADNTAGNTAGSTPSNTAGNPPPAGNHAAQRSARLPPSALPPASPPHVDAPERAPVPMRDARHSSHDAAGSAARGATPPPLGGTSSSTDSDSRVATDAIERPAPPPPPPPASTAAPPAAAPTRPAADDFRAPHPERQPGQAYDRGKPGFTLVETNGIRPLAPLFNATAAGHHGEVAAGLAIGGLASGLAHETAGAGMNGHALFASWHKRRRYDRQLSAMRDRDVAAFSGAAVGSDARRLDRLILTRGRDGKLDYDLDKVMKLAANDDPPLATQSAHARDVLLTLYIRDEVAGKRMSRAAYELGRNALGIASGAALIAGTQGLAAAPASAGAVAAKQAGFALALLNALDIGKGVRGLKQRMRNDKARDIDRSALRSRIALDTRDIDSETPDEAIKGIHAVLKDNGRIEADRRRFGKVFPGRWINEKKSTSNKNDMADLTAKHAMTIIDRSIDRFAGEGDAKLHAFYARVHARNASTPQQKRALRDAIDGDADLVDAYNLMRDLGMRGGEARVAIDSLIARRIEIGLANDAATSRARATDAGRKYAEQASSGERAPDDVAAMRTVLQRR